MLILPPGHWQEKHTPRTFGRRERWMMGCGAVLLAVIVVATVFAFTSKQKKSAHGCIDVSAATVIGGSELYRCGATARALCVSASNGPGISHAFQDALLEACRQAGLPVKPAASAAAS